MMEEIADQTLPKLLREKAKQMPKRIALREKDYGIWQEYSWQTYYDNVKWFANGLLDLGFQREDRLALIGDNRPEWVFAALAAQSLGGVSVGAYQDALPKEVAYFLNHCQAKFVVVEDQEQVDKLLEIMDQLPHVEYIIYYDPRYSCQP